MRYGLVVLVIAALLGACGSPPSTGTGQAPAARSVASTAAAPAMATSLLAAPSVAKATPKAASQVAGAGASSPSDPAISTSAATGGAMAKVGESAVDKAIDSNLGDHTRYRAVIDALQKAVATDDARGVAALVRYPIVVSIRGKNTTLKTPQAFVARYKEFMTPDIRSAIVDTRYEDLFVNYKGIMFGRGEAWIAGICKDAGCKSFDVKVVTLQHGPR